MKLLMVDSISRGEYFNFRNIDLKLLHSSVKGGKKIWRRWKTMTCARIYIVFKSERLYLYIYLFHLLITLIIL